MKKVISIALTLFLSLLTLPFYGFAQNEELSESKNDIIKGITYLELPETTFGGVTVDSELSIKNVVLNESLLQIQGDVHYYSQTIPFSIKGELKKSQTFTIGANGKFEDQTGNFSVIYLGLTNIQSQNENGVLLNEQIDGKVLRLYLLKNGTREFSIFEVDIDKLKNQSLLQTVFDRINNLEDGYSFGDYWFPLVFSPINGESTVNSIIKDETTGEEIVVPEIIKPDLDKISTMGQSIRYIDGANKEFSYWETYTGGGNCNITYKITGLVNTVFTGSMGGTTIKITRKNTESNCPLYVREDSPFGIGTFDNPVRLVDLTNGYDTFVDLTMDHTNAKKKDDDISVSIGFGVGLSLYGVSLGASYDINIEELASLNSTFTKSLAGYGTSTTFPHKIQGKYIELLLPVKNSQFYLHGNINPNTPSNNTRWVDGYAYFDISAKYDGELSWHLASIPGDRTFSINTYVFR